ncbi:PX domain-containing protein ypt35 [Saxophila tyrrhenica]|uniref:Endosomal/vacuolar adapter protein YPT35 n=1 Tax=Saxophila tyrrhenica TaxID=1690608 RepID=A0AAV9PHU4_9PEZI|nr:PX domain-containing protein ypt35 [Saxophila tyrrhenica]
MEPTSRPQPANADPPAEGHLSPQSPPPEAREERGDETRTPLMRKTSDAPPYWTRHDRTISSASYHSIGRPGGGPILLEDHSEETHELSRGCWAKSASIDEYVLVSGPTGIGAYVVWHCTVQTLKGGDVVIRKRYSEFDQLRTDLVRSFPHAEAMIPELPRKSVVSRFRPKFLEHRKNGLSHFLNCILLNPEFAASPMLKDFIFS